MCLLVFAYRQHPRYPLILAANRDEFHRRPTGAARFWEDLPGVLAGRDLRGGGTWLGVDRNGRIAALTNYRDPGSNKALAISRGGVVKDFLQGSGPPVDYLRDLSARRAQYNGFCTVLGSIGDLYYYASKTDDLRSLVPGIYGLSNRLLDTPWPKLVRAKRAFVACLSGTGPDVDGIFRLLADTTEPPDADLPDTGVGLLWERRLAPVFIAGEEYGTRSSTVVLADDRRILFEERTFAPNGVPGSGVKYELVVTPRSG